MPAGQPPPQAPEALAARCSLPDGTHPPACLHHAPTRPRLVRRQYPRPVGAPRAARVTSLHTTPLSDISATSGCCRGSAHAAQNLQKTNLLNTQKTNLLNTQNLHACTKHKAPAKHRAARGAGLQEEEEAGRKAGQTCCAADKGLLAAPHNLGQSDYERRSHCLAHTTANLS